MTWKASPPHVKQLIEDRIGSHVVEAIDMRGGFSPGLAARLRPARGKRIFVKASSTTLNPHTPGVHRREARIARALPQHAPVSRLLWTLDEGDDGWVILAFADIEGRLPALPWNSDELERVVEAIAAMHRALTPCPLNLPSAGDRISGSLSGWSRLAGDEPGLDPWSRRYLSVLQAWERDAHAAAAGEGIVHMDLRSDNIMLTRQGPVIVDWPAAAIGAAWVDMIAMAPSVVLEGGPEPAEFFVMHPAACVAHPDCVNAVLAAVAGYFTFNALQPPQPGLPTLRAFQSAQGEICRRWLAERTGTT